ncbi:hypothetical protein DL769_009265 [Monosporascus sp. CRB-8-3]|nr:hypothetical protein DL769_009265 [Monosporascus sp. CRB-8-3]
MTSPSAQTILVTGANGYIALHIVDQLFERGYNVRGTVRSQKASDKVRQVFTQYWGSRLQTVFVTDLTKPECYAPALDDKITAIIHAASPVHDVVEDNVRDMLDPAIKGATAILDAVSQMAPPSCRRVVQMSSFSAMLDPAQGFRPGYTYTEEDWNPVTFDEAVAFKNSTELYLASKSLSERATWEWVSQRKPDFDIVFVNPSMVFGPHLDELDATSTTSTGAMLWSLIDARSVPPLMFGGCVDVRDVAAIMVSALETPEAAGERFLVAYHFDWQSAADAAREGCPEITDRIPVGEPGTGKERALEHIYQVDGTKSVRVLGVKYRPLEETVKDSIHEFSEVEQRMRR